MGHQSLPDPEIAGDVKGQRARPAVRARQRGAVANGRRRARGSGLVVSARDARGQSGRDVRSMIRSCSHRQS